MGIGKYKEIYIKNSKPLSILSKKNDLQNFISK